MSAEDSDVLALREQLLNSLFTEGASMLETMGKKRKLGARRTEDEGEEESDDPLNQFLGTEEDPLKSAQRDLKVIQDDQDAVISSDPEIDQISRIRRPKRGTYWANDWKKRIYDTARESMASQRKPRSSTGNDVNTVSAGLWQQAMGAAKGSTG